MNGLPYSSQTERSTSLARGIAGAITGAAGGWLVTVAWAAQRWVLVALGLIGCLACVGWFVAARRGQQRAMEGRMWRLLADQEGVRSDGGGVPRRAWSDIGEIRVDEETLEVVLSPPAGPGQPNERTSLRILPCWGELGAYELAEWLKTRRADAAAGSACDHEND